MKLAWVAPRLNKVGVPLAFAVALIGLFFAHAEPATAQFRSRADDPGVRGGPAGAGGPISGLTTGERAAFEAGGEDFAAAEEVPDGLGPRMNLDSCGGCHIQPANGGSSPAVNPQIAFASKAGATNVIPTFLSANGPVREARFVRNADG